MTSVSFGSRLWEARTIITRSPRLALFGKASLQLLSWMLRLNPMQRHSRRLREARYLNVGCGRKPRPGFINLDYTWQPGVDLLWDLNWRLPFPENALRGLYTEHCMEHLPLEAVTGHVLSEFYRVLEPGGRLRLIVPDGGLYLKLYCESHVNPATIFPSMDSRGLVTPMMHVNQCFRDHGHLYAYDFNTLRHFLLFAGFSEVERRSFMQGDDPVLLLDSPERAAESLYIEAVK